MATKTTKRALLLSVVSLFICFTMLLGTTYAWFTDSVTSAGNIIKTGTLEVTLEYKTPMDTDWQDASQGAIFKYTNWEPGYTEVRYVKIENEGSLALKFMLNIIPNEQLAADAVDLAEVIDVYMVPVADDTQLPTVDRADDLSAYYVGTLSALMAENDGAAHGILQPAEKEVYTIVLKMQETAGNEYQNLSVGGGFVVQLLATQLAGPEAEANSETAETDDLGGDYDSGAEYPEVGLDNVTKEENVAASVEADDVVVDIPAGAPEGDYALAVSDKTVVTDDQGNATVSMDIDLKCDGEAVDGNYAYTVSVDIGAGYNLTKLIHRDQEITTFDYNVATGIVTFTTNSFSPFSFVCEKVEPVKVGTADELKAAVAEGGVIELSGDIELSEILVLSKPTVFDGNGYTLTSTAARAINVSGADGVLIKDLTIVAGGERAINVIQNATNVTVDNVNATSSNYTLNVAASAPGAVVTINNSDLTGLCTVNVAALNSKVTVTDSKIVCDDQNETEGESYAAIALNKDAIGATITVTGCEISVTEGSDSVAARNGATDGKITIDGSDKDVLVTVAYISQGDYYYSYTSLEEAIAHATTGDTIVLIRDITVSSTINVNKALTIDLNDFTITGINTTTATHNDLFLVKDDLTVKNGTVTLIHDADNMAWNGATSVFDVTAGGVLNIENATIENLGGTDMNFGVHLNNWGEVTLNVKNSTIKGAYCAVRVFNSGPDMNNVTINNSTIHSKGNRAFWVHNYASADFGGKVHSGSSVAYDEAQVKARLNFDIFGNGNTFVAETNTNGGVVRYGFYNTIYYTGDGALIKSAADQDELNSAIGSSNSVDVTLSEGAYTMPGTSGDVTISGTKDTVITVTGTPGGADLTFNGVTVKGSGYSTGVNAATVTYNNATIIGEMCLYREKVVFNNCTFELNGQYIWTYGAAEVEFNNCTFNTTGKAILIYNEGDGASKVTVKGCTFNATAGAKAGAISNQNCAAIEIDNFQSSGKGIAHELVTEGNTYSNNFSGEWRIKNYVADAAITVNGVQYTQIAVDGKLMTIDANKNITVID